MRAFPSGIGWRPLSGKISRKWQEWGDSNPRPSVLETDALPTELHSSAEVEGRIAAPDGTRKGIDPAGTIAPRRRSRE